MAASRPLSTQKPCPRRIYYCPCLAKFVAILFHLAPSCKRLLSFVLCRTNLCQLHLTHSSDDCQSSIALIISFHTMNAALLYLCYFFQLWQLPWLDEVLWQLWLLHAAWSSVSHQATQMRKLSFSHCLPADIEWTCLY